MKLPTFEIFIEDTEAVELAIVDSPAVEANFIYFNSEDIKMEFNDDKMIIKGPALIPNKKIYRNDSLGERYVFMSEETVIKFAELLMNKNGNRFNIGHTDESLQANIIESFFTEENNQFNVPKGSWIVSLKINDIDVWNKVKGGEFKGFSVEGLFSNELSEFNKTNTMQNELKEKLSKAINTVLFGETEEVEQVVVEQVVEQVVTDEKFSLDELKTLITPLLDEFKTSLLNEINGVKNDLKEVNGKIEAFSSQAITESVTVEQVANTVTGKSKAAEYFKN